MDAIYKLFTNGKIDNLDPTTKRLASVLFYVAIGVIVFIAALIVVDVAGHWGVTTPLGTFGDFFGGVLNPILAFLTVIGLAVTIVMQRATISTSTLQRFETTFFNLLDLHNKIVDELVFDPKIIPDSAAQRELLRIAGVTPEEPEKAHGRAVFAVILERIAKAETNTTSRVEIYRERLQVENNHVLGHYFRNLYQILRLADRLKHESIDASTIQTYTAIVRAQLSANELALLFYNCLDGMVDRGEFKQLVIDYRLLEHLPLRYDRSTKELYHENLPTEWKYFREYLVVVPPGETAKHRVPAPLAPGAFGTNPKVHEYLLDAQLPILPVKN
ncbi:putative phage abortive infection protein [Massilia agilis]|uniref:Phage abortive infection protein n=1 Tax=Massilia agilis TaxID=1811226 RepID=A0ABT2DE71_9BURK|nr:putative phage abortive infection protein [Massilia agilis]MCS0808728.1 putative phage abortive infection protein [Massilia agilis]